MSAISHGILSTLSQYAYFGGLNNFVEREGFPFWHFTQRKENERSFSSGPVLSESPSSPFNIC
jgi:hypothetical protein